LSDHLTCVLVAPVGVLGVVYAARESRVTAYGVAVVALLAGLLPYTYLFFADGPASWGRVESASDLLDIVTRHDYGTTSLMTDGANVPWTASWAR